VTITRRFQIADDKTRITFEEAKALHPDEWVVFSEPRFNTENTTFIDGVVCCHGKDHNVALDRSAEIDGAAAIDFTGTRQYERIIRHDDAKGKSTDQGA